MPTPDDLLALFPSGSRLDDDGTLFVGGCRLDDLAAEFGTPVFVVAEDALRDSAREYLAAVRSRRPRVEVAFRVEVLPVPGRSVRDGPGGPVPRRRGGRRDPGRGEGGRRSGDAGVPRQRQDQ